MATIKKAVAKKASVNVVQNLGVDWRTLYLYAVCLITLLVVLFSVVSFINGIVNIIFPDPAYLDMYAGKDVVKPTAQALAQQESQNQYRAYKSMFNSFTTFAIAGPLYLYHWRQTKKSA